jgi:hypothetical protein
LVAEHSILLTEKEFIRKMIQQLLFQKLLPSKGKKQELYYYSEEEKDQIRAIGDK